MTICTRLPEMLDKLARRGRALCPSAIARPAPWPNYPGIYLDMVRPGIALTGMGNGAGIGAHWSLRPVMSLKSRVSAVRGFDPDRYTGD